jgi:hypothetical protein
MDEEVSGGKALVRHGSKRGGTAGLAEMVAVALERRGVEPTTAPAGERPSVDRRRRVVEFVEEMEKLDNREVKR